MSGSGNCDERNIVVAVLARMFPSGTRRTDIPGWDPNWHQCVYIDLPSGQISYHYHDRDAELFSALPAYDRPWDGHTKEIAEARIREYLHVHDTTQQAVGGFDEALAAAGFHSATERD